MNNWEIVAQALINHNHDTEINYAEEYFICPHCGQCIYRTKWKEIEYVGIFGLCCPACGHTIEYMDTEE